MNAREEFEKEYNWIDKREQPMFMSVKYIQWLEKKVNEFEAEKDSLYKEAEHNAILLLSANQEIDRLNKANMLLLEMVK